MADDGVKISALNEILTAPATGEYAAIAKAGASYKRDLGLLPSTMQKSALVGYGGTPSGTNPYATQTGATSIATALATPLSDLSRVMRINGDGVPTFPDNVAGTVYKSNFSTTDGWVVSGGTLSVVNGELIATATATTMYVSRALSLGSGRQIRITLTSPTWGLILVGRVNGVNNATIPQRGYEQNKKVNIDAYVSGNLEFITTMYDNIAIGSKVIISEAYIGSGLYDTPVYGKDGRTAWINTGVLPVNGPRGKGMLFQGAQFLETTDSILGTSGAIAFRYNRATVGTNEAVIANLDYPAHMGVNIYISDSQLLVLSYGDGSTEHVLGLLNDIYADGEHDYVINYTPTTCGPVYRDGAERMGVIALPSIMIPSRGSTRIGCPTWGLGAMLNGTLSDILSRSSPMTQDDVTRYHNGDDAVDSQQKAITNVPNAIKICDSKGNIRQPGLPVYADNTAALAGGLVASEPYRTSTGVLMVVY